MTDPAVFAALQTALALVTASLPTSLENASLWALGALVVSLMAFSLLTSAVNRASWFLLKLAWPAIVLYLLMAAGIVPAPRPDTMERLWLTVEEEPEPVAAEWWSSWAAQQ